MGEKVSVACPFIGAGKTAGVAVWKIDNLEPVKLKDTEKGYFCTGDTYIVLNTKAGVDQDDVQHDIHFWLGRNTSQEKLSAVAIFVAELDRVLEGKTSQNRQMQGAESVNFRTLFKTGLKYRDSRSASSLQHVKKPKSTTVEPKLFQLQQTKGKPPKLEPVGLSISSLNSRGSFIFERPGHLAVWTGKYVPEKMQVKLKKVMKRIGEARGGDPQITFLHEGGQDDATMSFYCSLGADDPNSIVIADPWQEPPADDSGESGDSASGVIIMGEFTESDGSDVSSRASEGVERRPTPFPTGLYQRSSSEGSDADISSQDSGSEGILREATPRTASRADARSPPPAAPTETPVLALQTSLGITSQATPNQLLDIKVTPDTQLQAPGTLDKGSAKGLSSTSAASPAAQEEIKDVEEIQKKEATRVPSEMINAKNRAKAGIKNGSEAQKSSNGVSARDSETLYTAPSHLEEQTDTTSVSSGKVTGASDKSTAPALSDKGSRTGAEPAPDLGLGARPKGLSIASLSETASPSASQPASPASQHSTSSSPAPPAAKLVSSSSQKSQKTPQSRDTSAESKEVPDFVKVRSALRRSGIPADELEARRSQTGRDAPTEFCKNDAFSPSATSDTAKGSDLTKENQSKGPATKNLDPSADTAQVKQTSIAPGSKYFTYGDLKGMKADSGIVMEKKEDYLSPADFVQVFGCPSADFKKLPKWKQVAAKKEKGIF